MHIPKDLVAASAVPLVLGILAESESYGYAIVKRVAELSDGQLQWTDGMLYPLLHRLEKLDLVHSQWGQSDAGRRRKYYRITPKGRDTLMQHQVQWEAVNSALRGVWGGGSSTGRVPRVSGPTTGRTAREKDPTTGRVLRVSPVVAPATGRTARVTGPTTGRRAGVQNPTTGRQARINRSTTRPDSAAHRREARDSGSAMGRMPASDPAVRHVDDAAAGSASARSHAVTERLPHADAPASGRQATDRNRTGWSRT